MRGMKKEVERGGGGELKLFLLAAVQQTIWVNNLSRGVGVCDDTVSGYRAKFGYTLRLSKNICPKSHAVRCNASFISLWHEWEFYKSSVLMLPLWKTSRKRSNSSRSMLLDPSMSM